MTANQGALRGTEVLLPGGIVSPAQQCPSPNCDSRPLGAVIDLLVIHGISLPPGEFGSDDIDRLFTNCLDPTRHQTFPDICQLRVSAHLLIRRGGELVQFVPLEQRAWHAGVSQFQDRERCNDFSIGIELEGTDDVPYDDRQYVRLIEVVASLQAVYPEITPDRIVGHCDVAPGRKTDPGPAFDWMRLRTALTRAARESASKSGLDSK